MVSLKCPNTICVGEEINLIGLTNLLSCHRVGAESYISEVESSLHRSRNVLFASARAELDSLVNEVITLVPWLLSRPPPSSILPLFSFRFVFSSSEFLVAKLNQEREILKEKRKRDWWRRNKARVSPVYWQRRSLTKPWRECILNPDESSVASSTYALEPTLGTFKCFKLKTDIKQTIFPALPTY